MLPSNLVLYRVNKSINVHGYLLSYDYWIFKKGVITNYLVNWKNGKFVVVCNWHKHQRTINKNVNNFQSLLDLYHGDNECVALANAILGVDDYFYSMRNIIAGLI